MQLPAHAAQEWRGTVAELRRKQEKFEEKLKEVLDQHEAAEKEGEAALGTGGRTARDKQQEQVKRLAHQAVRIEAFWAAHDPQRGKPGHEIQSPVTDNESAKMFTVHGGLQGYNSQALVDAQHQVLVPADAFGTGPDYGQVPPRWEGAKAHVPALGLGEEYFAGKLLSADSNYQSEENLQTCAQAQRDAYIPDAHFRHRDPRFATPARPHPPPDGKGEEKFTEAEFTYDRDQECYRCPGGAVLKLRARRHQGENNR